MEINYRKQSVKHILHKIYIISVTIKVRNGKEFI